MGLNSSTATEGNNAMYTTFIHLRTYISATSILLTTMTRSIIGTNILIANILIEIQILYQMSYTLTVHHKQTIGI